MKGIILAAGLGTRLRPLTESRPKTLVEVGKKPILGFQIDALKSNNFDEIIICTGYKSEIIKTYCQEFYPDTKITFVCNEEYAVTNNMYSLYLAKEHLVGDVFVMNGDVAIDPNIIEGMKLSDSSLVATDVGRYISESMKVVVDNQGFIIDIAKTIPKDNAYGSSIDVYKFSPSDTNILKSELIKYFENSGDKKQWTEVLLQSLFQNKIIQTKPFEIGNSRWLEVDDHEDLAIASGIFFAAESEFKKKKIVFLDGDGTLFVGNRLIPGADIFVDYLLKKNLLVYILSNNTSKTQENYSKKLQSLGLTITPDNILLPTEVLINDIKKQKISDIYLLANKEVSAVFEKNGFNLNAENPQAVVLTYDTELTYQKISNASHFLHQGVRYFATHIDTVCPTEFGPIPDIGSMITMLETATGRLPEKTYGKPSPELLKRTLEKHKLDLSEAIIFGDRIYTDIKMGNEAGVFSVLVLTGETTDDDVKVATQKPDVVVKSIAQFLSIVSNDMI